MKKSDEGILETWYLENSLPIKRSDNGLEENYFYDDSNRLYKKVKKEEPEKIYNYSVETKKIETITKGSEKVYFHYDTVNRLQEISTDKGVVFTIVYGEKSRISEIIKKDRSKSETMYLSYALDGRVDEVRLKSGEVGIVKYKDDGNVSVELKNSGKESSAVKDFFNRIIDFIQ